MEHRSQLYQELTSAIELPDIPKEKERAETYIKRVNGLKLIAICCLLLYLISAPLHLPFYTTILKIAICMLAIYFAYRLGAIKKFRKILWEDCDPVRMLAFYGKLVSYAKNRKGWLLHFYNLETACFYLGNVEAEEKIQSLIAKYFQTPVGNVYYEMAGVHIEVAKGDLQAVQRHCENLVALNGQNYCKGDMKWIYMEMMQYPAQIQLYLSGSYSELYDCIKNAKSKHRSKCFEVKRNYYLYRVAMLLEDWEKAEKHRNFVVEYGGTLRYRGDIIREELSGE